MEIYWIPGKEQKTMAGNFTEPLLEGFTYLLILMINAC